MRRYRCGAESCGWEGLLASPRRRSTSPRAMRASRPGWLRPVPLFLIALFTGVVGVQAARTYRSAMPDPVLASLTSAPVVPFGQSHEGSPLSPDHPLLAQAQTASDAGAAPPELPGATAPYDGAAPAAAAAAPTSAGTVPKGAQPGSGDAAPLALRQDCAWGDPGRDPYRGTVEEALQRAKLPPEVVREIARKVQAGEANDRLEITTASIRAVHDPREFDPKSVAMTFGRTLCVNTRVNFQPGHVERADLFEAADKAGNTYSIMVPYVCGNVSVLGERAERGDAAPSLTLGPDGRPVMKMGNRILPAALVGTRTSTTVPGSGTRLVGPQAQNQPSGTVPEPGTLASLLIGLVSMGWFLRRRR
jgi:hypothetical protein